MNKKTIPNVFDIADNMRSETRICTQMEFEKMRRRNDVSENCKAYAAAVAKAKTMSEEEAKKHLSTASSYYKEKLPVLLPHAHYINGVRKNVNAQESPWCNVDYDHIDNPLSVWNERILPHVENGDMVCALAFISPSGQGLKFIVQRPVGMSIKQTMDWVDSVVGMPAHDDQCKDLARCCFIVPDDAQHSLLYKPELFFAPVVEEFVAKPIITEAKSSASETKSTTSDAKPEATETLVKEGENLTYHGIPYSDIVSAYWKVNYNGVEPSQGDRNSLTFELACALRTITDNNRELMSKIIPCYDGLSEVEKTKCIDSAISEGTTRIPKKLKDTLAYLVPSMLAKTNMTDGGGNTGEREENINLCSLDIMEAVEQIKAGFKDKKGRVKDCFVRNNKKSIYPAGLEEILESLPDNNAMGAISVAGPLVGALATQVSLDVHGDMRHLNLQSYVVAPFGCDKSRMDEINRILSTPIKESDAVGYQKERRFNEEKNKNKNKKEQPVKPITKIRFIAKKTSVTKILMRLEELEGVHAWMYLSESDSETNNKKQSYNAEYSTLKRNAYDEDSYTMDFANDTGRIEVPNVRLNITECTTPDGIQRAFTNYTDGELSRALISELPDTTFAPLVIRTHRSEASAERLIKVARLLTLMKGDLELKLLEKRSQVWLQRILDETIEGGTRDATRAALRKRIAVSGMRMTASFMLMEFACWLMKKLDENEGELPEWADGCKTAQEYLLTHPDAVVTHVPKFQYQGWLNFFESICDYYLDTVLKHFRQKIEAATKINNSNLSTSGLRKTSGSNDVYLGMLPTEFTYEDAKKVRPESPYEQIKSMVHNWKNDGLIVSVSRGCFKKN